MKSNNTDIALMYAGSLAYGTNLPTSDVDKRGIFIADQLNIRTPFFNIGEYNMPNEEDGKMYELNKFMELCVNCNPNIIELLWTDEADIISRSPAYDLIRSHRADLLSAKISHTTTGYAMSQLKRIKGHNKWLTNPQPLEPPKQTDFVSLVHNFTEEKLFNIDMNRFRKDHRLVHYENGLFGVYPMVGYDLFSNDNTLNTLYDTNEDVHTRSLTWYQYLLGTSRRNQPKFIVKFNRDVYKEAKHRHKQYWEWKANRNVARSELESKFGYDTKHAMHLVRLLRMGIESLEHGEILVRRPDAKELLEIRNGSMSYEEILAYANSMEARISALRDTTTLRSKPNVDLAAKLVIEAQDLVWS